MQKHALCTTVKSGACFQEMRDEWEENHFTLPPVHSLYWSYVVHNLHYPYGDLTQNGRSWLASLPYIPLCVVQVLKMLAMMGLAKYIPTFLLLYLRKTNKHVTLDMMGCMMLVYVPRLLRDQSTLYLTSTSLEFVIDLSDRVSG